MKLKKRLGISFALAMGGIAVIAPLATTVVSCSSGQSSSVSIEEATLLDVVSRVDHSIDDKDTGNGTYFSSIVKQRADDNLTQDQINDFTAATIINHIQIDGFSNDILDKFEVTRFEKKDGATNTFQIQLQAKQYPEIKTGLFYVAFMPSTGGGEGVQPNPEQQAQKLLDSLTIKIKDGQQTITADQFSSITSLEKLKEFANVSLDASQLGDFYIVINNLTSPNVVVSVTHKKFSSVTKDFKLVFKIASTSSEIE